MRQGCGHVVPRENHPRFFCNPAGSDQYTFGPTSMAALANGIGFDTCGLGHALVAHFAMLMPHLMQERNGRGS
jgi:hypothetical protein